MPMGASPEDPTWQVPLEDSEEVVQRALQLLRDFDSVPMTELTPMFYQHGFGELNTAMRDLLKLLGHDPDA